MSKLTDTIALLYSYQQADINKLTRVITERRKASWLNTLAGLAKTHGCNRFPQSVKGSDARELERMSKADAESIARTFNREVRAQIERIYKENPRANRNAYFKRLEAWAKKRDAYKSLQIGLNTDSTARRFAQERFYTENKALAQKFVASGPPAVCEICLNIFAAGVVNFDYTRKHPLPAHIFCPHTYKSIAPVRASCEAIWLG